uniref:RHS repeat-associated core domain-containing protein n=1 Tax=Xylanibacter caecicola TaxID=2736294 RepID=UPI00259D1C32
QNGLIYESHCINYCGDIIYENIKPVPNRILFDGGYVKFSNKQPVYHFYLMDHQGNVRVVADAQGNIEQTNNYYPFGALFGDGTGDDVQRYKYNGKELERLLALDWYDYGARWYDPVLARWHAVDPLAEKYPDISPYVYCNNNAVNAIDPDGRKIVIVGDRQQRISVLGQLQKLTNDKLGVRRSDGMVIILSRGTRNRDKKLVNGTRLVSELINHERSMDIRPSADNSREHDRYQMDALNGKGTDVSIYYNMRQNPTVFTRNPKTGKIKEEAIPSHIVLGHELIHGHRSMNGKAVYWENRSDYTYKTENGNIMKTEAETEELETVGIRGNYTHTENKLRKEQDLNKRIEY